MKRITGFLIAIPLVIALSVGWAAGDVLYSNFGTGLTFDNNTSHSYLINELDIPEAPGACPESKNCVPASAIAVEFELPVIGTPNRYYELDDIKLPLFLTPDNTGPNTLDAAIVLGDYDTGVLDGGGSLLFLLGLNNLTSQPSIVRVEGGLPRPDEPLNGGQPYWLVVYSRSPGTVAAWNWNPNCSYDPITKAYAGCDVSKSITFGSASDLAYENDGGDSRNPAVLFSTTWNEMPIGMPRPAFEIDGIIQSSVPEPTSVFLLGTGLLALCLLSKRFRAASTN